MNISKSILTNKILYFILISLAASQILFSDTLPPKKAQPQQEEPQPGVLKELLPDKSIAPNINGLLYNHNQDTLLSEEAFTAKLTKHSINYKNNITVLVFWETKCGFCQLMLPKINSLYQKYKDQGVNFYAVNSKDLSHKKNLIKFFNKYKHSKVVLNEKEQKIQSEIDTTQNKQLNIPILFVDNKAQQNFLVTGFPTTYVIDEEGLVYTAMIGYFNEYDAWMSFLLENMLGDKKVK